MGDLIDFEDPLISYRVLSEIEQAGLKGEVLGLLCTSRDFETLYSYLTPEEKWRVAEDIKQRRREEREVGNNGAKERF